MKCSSLPLPGLYNCLASSTSSLSTFVSALTAEGQILISTRTKSSLPFSAPATAHACTGEHFFARAYKHSVFFYANLNLPPIQFQPLHFEVRHLALYARDASIIVVAGGYDGAYVAQLPFNLNLSNTSHFTQPNYTFKLLHGSQSFPVIYVAATSDAIAAVLMDSRVAIWADLSDSAVTFLDAEPTTTYGDRITDLTFTRSFLAIAYWGGTVICYSRSGSSVNKLFIAQPDSISSNNLFLKRGPTIILQSPASLYPGGPVVLFATAHGALSFVNLSNGTTVTRKVKSSCCDVLIKGLCCFGDQILLWLNNRYELVTLPWPSIESLSSDASIMTNP